MTNVEDLQSHRARKRWRWLADVIKSKTLKPRDKVVAAALCQRFGENTGKAWPSHATLAADCGSSVKFARLGLKGLEAEKYLRIENKSGGLSTDAQGAIRGNTCTYYLTFPSDDEGGTSVPCKGGTDHGGNVVRIADEGGTESHSRWYERANKPYKEPLLEPEIERYGDKTRNQNPYKRVAILSLAGRIDRYLRNAGEMTADTDALDEFLNSHTVQFEGALPGNGLLPLGEAKLTYRCLNHIGLSAADFLGYSHQDASVLDATLLGVLPIEVLAAMVRRIHADCLTHRHVAQLVIAMGIPRNNHDERIPVKLGKPVLDELTA